jgi:MAP kinase interacting serine/threonine kinase
VEREAAEVTREVATALAFLHENGVAHRDLKPQNVLCLDKDQVRGFVS